MSSACFVAKTISRSVQINVIEIIRIENNMLSGCIIEE